MNDGIARLLRQVGCDGIPDVDSHLVRVRARSVAFRSGDVCRNGLIVLKGCVRVSRLSQTGAEVVLYRVHAGEACAITTACALGMTEYPADGHAEDEVIALALPGPLFRQHLADNEIFRDAVFAQHARRFGDLVGRIESITSERNEVRLVRCLVERSVGGMIVATHGQLASDIGSTREVVSRNLKVLEHRGWIRLRRNLIELLGRDRLRDLLHER